MTHTLSNSKRESIRHDFLYQLKLSLIAVDCQPRCLNKSMTIHCFTITFEYRKSGREVPAEIWDLITVRFFYWNSSCLYRRVYTYLCNLLSLCKLHAKSKLSCSFLLVLPYCYNVKIKINVWRIKDKVKYKNNVGGILNLPNSFCPVIF